MKPPQRKLVEVEMRIAKLAVPLAILAPVVAAAATVNVTVQNFNFSPSTVTIARGDTVQWNFTSFHTSTSDATTGAEVWDSGTRNAGQTFAHTFTTAGDWTYHCNVHPFMTAVVRVLAPAPTLTSVNPAAGPTGGGTSVTLSGTNFAAGCTIDFGGAAATGVAAPTSTTLTATTPSHAAGAVNVTVTCPGGSAALANGFTFDASPSITSVNPTAALPGATVTIAGSGFRNGATVTFAGVVSPTVTFIGSTTLTAIVPNLAIGPAAIIVTNPDTLGASFNGFTVTSLAVPMFPRWLLALLAAVLAIVAIVIIRS